MVAVLELDSPRQLVRRLSCRVGVLIAPRHRVQKINCNINSMEQGMSLWYSVGAGGWQLHPSSGGHSYHIFTQVKC